MDLRVIIENMPSPQDRYDLHTHSRHSDGTTTPAEIAKLAAGLGLAGFALTDHDTANGWDEAREAAAEHGLDFLPGFEMTTMHRGRNTHLLAYGADPQDDEMAALLQLLGGARQRRAERMVEKLAQDFDITWENVAAVGIRAIGRPHIADALVRKGIVADRDTAFATLLSSKSPYYAYAESVKTVDAIRIVCAAGGVPVLAHPAAKRNRSVITPAELEQLIAAGLLGVKMNHPENSPELLTELQRTVADFPLLITGSSDFHGAGKINRVGEETTAAETVLRIRELARIKH